MKYNYNYRNEQGQPAPYVLPVGDHNVVNPSAELLAEAGFYPYTPPQPTAEEIAEQERIAEIDALKSQLAATDYIALKAIEGYDCDTIYPNWKAERKALRDRINELEEAQ